MEETNIWTACGDGQFEIVKAFVAGGISVNAQDDYGYSPLHAACSYRNSEIATWLLSQGARVDLKDSDGETAGKLSTTDSRLFIDIESAFVDNEG